MNIQLTANAESTGPDATAAPSHVPSTPSTEPGESRIQNPASEIEYPASSIASPASNPQLPFQRFPGETPRAFSAFMTWFQLGHARSHQAVADKLGEGLPTVKNWASKYDWSDRLLVFTSGVLQQQALDTVEQQRKQAADWSARLNRFREQEWDAAQKLLSAAQCFLETFGDDHVHSMTLSQVSRALSISSAIARSALTGLELPPSSEPTLAPIQQQMLDALKRLSSPSPVGTQMGGRPSATASPISKDPGVPPGGPPRHLGSGDNPDGEPSFDHRVPNQNPVSGIEYPVSGIQHPACGIEHPVSAGSQPSTLNPQPLTLNPVMTPEEFVSEALKAGCPPDQVENLVHARLFLQPRQLEASAAARLCDLPNGPTMIGFGGARGGGKSHWLLVQIAADDCQRYPGLKVLLLRKSAKTAREAFEDLRQRLFTNLKYTYSASAGVILFANGSRIVIKHYQNENEINNSYLGIEYDTIAIEEATTLTERKISDIKTCCRTSKPGWRPRIYSTTNPGGVGHDWYYRTFIVPWETNTETKTRFIRATVRDNKFLDPQYEQTLAEQTGWRKDAWLDGNWHIEAGQFFKTFNHRIHVVSEFNDANAVEWFAAMDYGYTHYTVFLLGCLDVNGNMFIVDEHAERGWIPKRHLQAIKDMLLRHRLLVGHPNSQIIGEHMKIRMRFDPPYSWHLARIAVGPDLFSRQYDGSTIASQFRDLGAILHPANTNRVQGWAEIQDRLGDPAAGIQPTLFFHERCKRLINTLPYLQHDPDHPADVLKSNTDEEGLGGDDSADSLRYLVATKIPRTYVLKLRGL